MRPDVMNGLRRLVEQRETTWKVDDGKVVESPAVGPSRETYAGSKSKGTKWDEMLRLSEKKTLDRRNAPDPF